MIRAKHLNKSGNKEKAKDYKHRWRLDNKEHVSQYQQENRKLNPEKSSARSSANYAVKTGKLIPSPRCQLCLQKKPDIEKHHPDYDKRLDVIWLCDKCHGGKIHNKLHPWYQKHFEELFLDEKDRINEAIAALEAA
jgi:hypothetical protein